MQINKKTRNTNFIYVLMLWKKHTFSQKNIQGFIRLKGYYICFFLRNKVIFLLIKKNWNNKKTEFFDTLFSKNEINEPKKQNLAKSKKYSHL